MEIERFSQVMHLGSTVVAEISDQKDGLDVIDAVLPAGTLSGAPKFRACEIIEELEESKRGTNLRIQSGAGIVADSVPEQEFKECQNKARAVVLAIEEAKGGIGDDIAD